MDYDKWFKIPQTWLEKSLEESSKLNSVELYVWIMLYLWNVLPAVS